MALVEGCRHSVEISIPVSEVENESQRVTADVQKRAKLPGFRPGKAPTSIIRKQFSGDIRQQVLENLIPKALSKQFEADNLHPVDTPNVSEIHFHDGEPLRFKAEFEVIPEIELDDYKDVEVPYNDPEVTDEDVNTRIEELREQKAEYVNVDPRPLEDGDYAVLSLQSLSGVEEPVKQDEMVLEIGGSDTVEAFSDNLRGAAPGDQKEFDVAYPEDYGAARLAGKTVHFSATVTGVRRKELPELNDEFAQDLGDFRNVDELRDAIRKSIFAQRQQEAQNQAKEKIVDALVDRHDFPVPEVFVDRQIKNRVEQSLRAMAGEGIDPRQLKLDWTKLKEIQKDKAMREVKASLLLSRISEREAIHPTNEEVDREVERFARQNREPVAAVRMRFEKDGTMNRIANNIRTEKTLNFLFEHARKTA
ncbi:MAG TPA: trigger factor [Candidatus Limnocylindrales bacterium]|nr:trigger factor [Candidatus Limnocylindrales bacterium]